MLIFDRDGLVVLLEQMLLRSWNLLLSKLFSSLLGEGSIVWYGLVAKLGTSGVFFKRGFLICADAFNVRVVLTGQQWDPEKDISEYICAAGCLTYAFFQAFSSIQPKQSW